MKLQNLFILSCFFSVTILVAQEKDSIDVKLHHENPFVNFINTEITKQPFLLFFNPVKPYTQATFGFNKKNNTIKSKQDESSNRDLFVKANGIFSTKNLWMLGNLSFTKNYQNQKGYNLSNLIDTRDIVEKSPFYNVAYQEGNWNNQLYKINGTILYNLSNKWKVSAGVDYYLSEYFRTVNPIPKLKYIDATLRLSIARKLKNSIIGFTINNGFMNNDISIDYLGSASDLNLPVNESIYNRLSVGLGFIESAKTLLSQEKETSFGGALFYHQKSQSKLFSATVDYLQRKHSFYEVFIKTRALLGNYTNHAIHTNINYWNLDTNWIFNLKNTFKTGSNFRTTTQGKNYEATSFNAIFNIRKQTKKMVYGFFTSYDYLAQKDFQAVNSYHYHNISLGGNLFRKLLLNKGFLYGDFGYMATFNLQKEQQFLTPSKFVNEATLPSFYLASSSQYKLSLKIGYQKQIKEATILNYGIKINSEFFPKITQLNNTNNLNTAFSLYLKITY